MAFIQTAGGSLSTPSTRPSSSADCRWRSLDCYVIPVETGSPMRQWWEIKPVRTTETKYHNTTLK